jgi:hypothetical protein
MTDGGVELRKNCIAVKMLHQRAKVALARNCRLRGVGF